MKKLNVILRYALGLPVFAVGAYLTNAYPELPLGSILILILMLLECVSLFLETEKLLDLRMLFTVSWLGGISLSALHLSELQSAWSVTMWLSCAAAYFLFIAGYDLVFWLIGRKKRKTGTEIPVLTEEVRNEGELSAKEADTLRHIFQAVLIVFAAGMLSFLAECIRFRFELPIISDKPHAYTEFHITGIHYFVVSLCFVHPLTVIYIMKKRKLSRKEWVIFTLVNVFALLVPLLMLSKFQLCIAVGLPILTWVLMQKKVPRWALLLILAAAVLTLAAAFSYMMVMRKYPDGYLEEIFQFKNRNTPMLIQYPYIYVVNNFENLNLMTKELSSYTLGIRTAFPFFALTGLKFFPPIKALLDVPEFVTIEELTTRTLIYDWYGDFGPAGVMIFSFITGAISSLITVSMRKKMTVFGILLYIQFAVYLALAFFSTWFSNPTTFFWIALSACAALWTTKKRKQFRFSIREMTGINS